MKSKNPKLPDLPDDSLAGGEEIPSLFCTIHWKSPSRPNGYTAEDVAELNRLANLPKQSST
jgi:hypothetical protein